MNSIIIVALFLAVSLAIDLPQEFLISNCHTNLPYFSVGDLYLGDSNYTSIVQKQRVLVIGTLKQCLSCCSQESVFQDIQKIIESKPALNGIQIGRVELSTNKEFQLQFKQIKRFPFFIFFDGFGNHFLFSDILDSFSVIRFLERAMNPITEFGTFSALQQFLEKEDKDQSGYIIETVKVIALFYESDEMEYEIEKFKEAAMSLINRSEVYFCILINPNEIKIAKSYYQDKWFFGTSLNSIVIQRAKELFEIINVVEIIVDMKDLYKEIIYKSLRLIDELTMENYEYYSQKTILVAVVDSIVDLKTTKQLLNSLETIAKHFYDKLSVVWVEGNLNPEKKKMLGISMKAQLPQVAFFRINDDIKLIFPQDMLPLNYISLFQFVEDYFVLPLKRMQIKYLDQVQWQKQIVVQQTLTEFQMISSSNFTKKLMNIDFNLNQNTNIIHYFLDFSNQIVENELKEINHAAKRIKQLFGKGVMKFYYSVKSDFEDTQDKPVIDFVNNLKSHTIYMHSALGLKNKQKQFKPFEFKGKLKAKDILQFISSKSYSKKMNFQLPSNPEIPEERLIEYFARNKTSVDLY